MLHVCARVVHVRADRMRARSARWQKDGGAWHMLCRVCMRPKGQCTTGNAACMRGQCCRKMREKGKENALMRAATIAWLRKRKMMLCEKGEKTCGWQCTEHAHECMCSMMHSPDGAACVHAYGASARGRWERRAGLTPRSEPKRRPCWWRPARDSSCQPSLMLRRAAGRSASP